MKKENSQSKLSKENNSNKEYPQQDIDKLQKLADKKRTRKPGSQSNSSDRHNTGRGGGK